MRGVEGDGRKIDAPIYMGVRVYTLHIGYCATGWRRVIGCLVFIRHVCVCVCACCILCTLPISVQYVSIHVCVRVRVCACVYACVCALYSAYLPIVLYA